MNFRKSKEKRTTFEKEFAGKGYGDFKKSVGEAVVATLEPIQKKFNDLQKNKDYIDEVLRTNTERAGKIAERTLSKVKKKLGFTPRV